MQCCCGTICTEKDLLIDEQAQDCTRMGGSFGRGDARSNPTFEPSESSSLLQPSSQNTVQVCARPHAARSSIKYPDLDNCTIHHASSVYGGFRS